jgi:pimeloyl-ACP methyl ester carboxylesterase
LKSFTTTLLEIAYLEFGPPSADGVPIFLLHGFPDDGTAWGGVGERLARAGRTAFAPYARGCGPSRYRRPDTPRDGTSAARAGDLLELMDGLGIGRAILIGQDWGMETAQAVAMLSPERVERLVILNGHGLYNMAVARSGLPSFETLAAGWYQWLFQSPLGEAVLQADRKGLARFLWSQWSPDLSPDAVGFDTIAISFDNPDWVATVLSAYRGGAATGDPRNAEMQARLAKYPPIQAPTLNLQGADDGVDLFRDTQLGQEAFYHGGFEQIVLGGCGHFLQRERPDAVAKAILDFI